MSEFYGMLSSPPGREALVYEIWERGRDRQVAEISNEPNSRFELEILAPEEGTQHSFDLDEFVTAILKGRSTLLDRNG